MSRDELHVTARACAIDRRATAMAGTDDRSNAYNVPPEMREFVRKRDQRKCLLCGASNTPPDTALIVAGSPWDEIELEWLKERGLVPEAFNAIHPQNIISLCPNHHELFLHRRWCFVPCPEDRHIMRIHEEQDMRDRLYRRGTLGPGHSIPRTVPQLSGKFDFLNCAFGDDALSITPAGGRMTLVSTMPLDHESAQNLPRPPQYPLPGVNPFVILAHAAKCVGGPRKPIFPEIEQEVSELVNAYNLDPSSFPPPAPNLSQSPNVQTYQSPRESTSTHDSDSEPESRSSSPTSMDAPPPAPIVPPPPTSARTRNFPKPSVGTSPEQPYHTGYGISRQDTGQSHYSTGHFTGPTNTAGTQPIPIFRPPSALATSAPHPNLMAEGTSPSSGTGTGGGERDRSNIPPPPPIPHHLQSQASIPAHMQQQMTGTGVNTGAGAGPGAGVGANAGRRRQSDNPPPPVQMANPPPPAPPSAQAFAQQSQSFPQYAQYPSATTIGGAAREGPGLTRRPSKLRHSEDLRGTIRSPPPIPIGVTTGMGPRSPDRDRVVSGSGDRVTPGAGIGNGPKSPDVPLSRRESHSQFPRPRERERERDRDRDRDWDNNGEPFVFGPDVSAADIITRLTEGRSGSSADFSGRRRNGST
ncbi:hypothetical protein RHS03_04017, partial [Rhizoctonia solani]